MDPIASAVDSEWLTRVQLDRQGAVSDEGAGKDFCPGLTRAVHRFCGIRHPVSLRVEAQSQMFHPLGCPQDQRIAFVLAEIARSNNAAVAAKRHPGGPPIPRSRLSPPVLLVWNHPSGTVGFLQDGIKSTASRFSSSASVAPNPRDRFPKLTCSPCWPLCHPPGENGQWQAASSNRRQRTWAPCCGLHASRRCPLHLHRALVVTPDSQICAQLDGLHD